MIDTNSTVVGTDVHKFLHTAVAWYENDLTGASTTKELQTCLAQTILRRFAHLKLVQEQIDETDQAILVPAKKLPQIQVLAEQLVGCGQLTAYRIVAEIGDIQRFDNDDQLARYGGLAPIPASSGRSDQMHTDPYGNRKLNHAIHTIALSQIANRGYPPAVKYYRHKLTEGKTKLWAIRCLKRQVIKKVYRLLVEAVQP